jgi:HAD superfamily hydrolase (TIGR01549 family)
MNIKTFFIDVGGVLVSTQSTEARRIWEEKLHLKPRQLTKELQKIQPAKEATIGLVTTETIWNNVAKKYSLTKNELAQLRKDFYAGEKLNQQFYEYVKQLHNDFKIILFSNVWDDGRVVYGQKFGLDKICDQMILSAEIGMRKPHKKMFKYALKQNNVLPSEAVFIDDTLENIKAGQEIGLNCIHFKNTEEVISQIDKLI